MLDKINEDLKKLHNDLQNIKGTECEVHTRIVGYYRAVKNFNAGKAAEYTQRKYFDTILQADSVLEK